MTILICNERFLFRFGVDRVLIMIALELKKRGHRIILLANRFDPAVTDLVADKTVAIEESRAGEYIKLDQVCREIITDDWDLLFSGETIDLVFCAGWPFLSAIRVFREREIPVVFSDHGVVPMDSFAEGPRRVLSLIHQLRSEFLPWCNAVVGVSHFITESQSRTDTGGNTALLSILNAVDHIDQGVWSAEVSGEAMENPILKKVSQLQNSGSKIIINLGRWEPGCYKNSEAVVSVVRAVRVTVPETLVLVLARKEELSVPDDLKEAIIPVGFPSDSTLKALMSMADIGLSVSLWEGFNLPLGEMQWLRRPVLAFDIGAHPEVIVHPWFLCRDVTEMAEKTLAVFSGRGPRPEDLDSAQRAFRSRFVWQSVVDQYESAFVRVALQAKGTPKVIIDVTNACHDPANSGVIRVTRRVSREMQDFVQPIFVTWDDSLSSYVVPTQEEYQQLGQFNGPRQLVEMPVSPTGSRILLTEVLESVGADRTWLFITETLLERRGKVIRSFARANRISVAAIFYDAIPILRPDFCKDQIIRENHGAYMQGLAECDLVVPISSFSDQCLHDFWKSQNCAPIPSHPILIAGDFPPSAPPLSKWKPSDGVRILCVSTLEPRKNHRGLLAAVHRMEQLHPELEWRLTLVGNRYAGAPEIPELVELACRSSKRIQWLGITDDETLIKLYQEATFTIYPSVIEGFGLPIIESLFYGRPCITYQEGVMAELAAGGGCLTTDVLDVDLFAQAIYQLATDEVLLEKLAAEAAARPLKSWNTYAAQVLELFLRSDAGRTRRSISPRQSTWLQTLFSDWKPTPIQNHQFTGTLVLTGVLARLAPSVALAITRSQSFETDLCAAYCDSVVHYSTDRNASGPLAGNPNVRELTGQFQDEVVRTLVESEQGYSSLDLIYHDGSGPQEDMVFLLNLLLKQTPRTPLFVLLQHRRGSSMDEYLAGWDWQKSPFVQSVEHGFVESGLEQRLSLVFVAPQARAGV